MRASLRLPADAASPTSARRFVERFCRAAELDEGLCSSAALLTTELVANAVKHGRSAAVLEAHLPPGLLRVSVHDEDPALPAVGPFDPTSEGGRGMQLVDGIAAAWGVERDEHGGKSVWFELRREQHR